MRAVFAGVVSGYDLTSMNRFLSILELPHLPDSFDTVYIKEIYEAAKKAVKERLARNRAKVLKNNPTGEVPVKFDGTYQTRGFTSQVGVIWISHADSDVILDFVIQSKKCFQCDHYRGRTVPEHDCTANFEGSSTEMERRAATTMFSRSKSLGLTSVL